MLTIIPLVVKEINIFKVRRSSVPKVYRFWFHFSYIETMRGGERKRKTTRMKTFIESHSRKNV
jgi:hypothetical protein